MFACQWMDVYIYMHMLHVCMYVYMCPCKCLCVGVYTCVRVCMSACICICMGLTAISSPIDVDWPHNQKCIARAMRKPTKPNIKQYVWTMDYKNAVGLIHMPYFQMCCLCMGVLGSSSRALCFVWGVCNCICGMSCLHMQHTTRDVDVTRGPINWQSTPVYQPHL